MVPKIIETRIRTKLDYFPRIANFLLFKFEFAQARTSLGPFAIRKLRTGGPKQKRNVGGTPLKSVKYSHRLLITIVEYLIAIFNIH